MSAWPPWIKTDEHDTPVFDRGMLQFDPDARCPIPDASSSSYRTVVHDAYLLADRPAPVAVDGRKQMAMRHLGQLDRAERPSHPDSEQLELRELAHRTKEPISELYRLSVAYRQALLLELRQADAARAREEIRAFRARLAQIGDERHAAAAGEDGS